MADAKVTTRRSGHHTGRCLTALLVLATAGATAWGQADEQTRRKTATLHRIAKFVHQYDKHLFSKWICLGKMAKFRERINHAAVGVFVDTAYNDKQGASACYVVFYGTRRAGVTLRTIYSEDLVLRFAPERYEPVASHNETSAMVLWHEMTHAISHGHQLKAITPSRPLSNPDDEFYVEWMEDCVINGIPPLTRFEKILKDNGKKPSPEAIAKSRRMWKHFLKMVETPRPQQKSVPTPKQRKELEQITGFRIDPNDIAGGYLALGYPPEYFGEFVTDAEAYALFPSAADLGTSGLEASREKTKLDDVFVGYMKYWKAGPPGRSCSIELSLYGSPKLARIVWDAVKPTWRKATPLAGLGDEAYLIRRGSSTRHMLVLVRNAHLLYLDHMVVGDLKSGPISIKPLPLNNAAIKKMIANIEAREMPPIPQGVMTAMPGAKSTPKP